MKSSCRLSRRILPILLAVAFPVISTPSVQAAPDKLDARLKAALSGQGNAVKTLGLDPLGGGSGVVHVFVSGPVDEALLREHGAEPGTVLPNLATARIPLARVEALARSPRVEMIQAAEPVFPLLDKNRTETEVVQTWGAPPPNYPVSGETGAGVILGIVDTGIDFNHQDLRKSNNTTRILYLWDQGPGNGTPPSPWNYGQHWTASQINSGLCTQVDIMGHGTHVAGVAAGSGRATGNGLAAYRYVGMAPEADIIAVKLVGGNDVQVLDAVSYIFSKAASLNKKAVVCVTVGKQSGPHDATDPLNAGIDALSGAGKIVVAAAGNEGKSKIHSRVRPNKNQTATATFSVPSYLVTGSPFIEIEGWFNEGQSVTFKLVSPSGFTLGPLTMGQNGSMSNIDGWSLVQWTVPASGPREIYCMIQPPAPGTWRLEVKNVGQIQANVDFWFTNSVLSQGKVPVMVQAQSDSFCIVSPASATRVLAVGAYCAKRTWVSQTGQTVAYSGAVLNALADFSSIGPRRDGVLKPDITASGYGCASSRAATASFSNTYIVDDGVHVMMTGTSIAAGVAAGAVALLLEESPGLTPEAARMTLQMRANTDAQTGAVPNEKWGYGKLSMGAGTSGIIDTPMAGIGGLSLGVPYPNPLQTTTRMDFSLEKPSIVHVRVYDLQGREVRSLISGPLNGGSHFATWDGNDGQGRAVPSGRYYMTVSALPAGNEDAGVPEGTPAVLRQSRAVTILR